MTIGQHDRRNQDSNSSLPTMQYVEPEPMSDPRYYDASQYGQPTQRPAAVPIQQPQPITPVSQSVYKAQAPYDTTEFTRYQDSSAKRNGYADPQIITVEPKSASRNSPKDSNAAVRFSFTDEQERRHVERDETRTSDKKKKSSRRESNGDQDSDRRRRKSRRDSTDQIEEVSLRDENRPSKDGSWVEPAAIGLAGAAIGAAVAGEVASKSSEEKRRRRREERRQAEEDDAAAESRSRKYEKSAGWGTMVDAAVAASAVEAIGTKSPSDRKAERETQNYDDMSEAERERLTQDRERIIAKRAAALVKRAPSPVHESYASYFAPDILSKPAEGKEKVRDANADNDVQASGVPQIVTIEPKDHSSNVLVFAGLEKFADDPPVDLTRLSFPWRVPPLRLINPTPPPPAVEAMKQTLRAESPEREGSHDTEPQPRSRSSSKGKVTFGANETHEYEVITPEEPREEFIADSENPAMTSRSTKDEAGEVESPVEEIKRDHIPGAFEDDIDFAATIAAGLEQTGFDPNIVIEDPQYRRRDSPPGSNERPFYQQPFSETMSGIGAESRSIQHGWVEDVELPETPKDEARTAEFATEDGENESGKKKKKSRSKSDSVDDSTPSRDWRRESADAGAEMEIIDLEARDSEGEEPVNGDRPKNQNGTREASMTAEPESYDSATDGARSAVSAPVAGEMEGQSRKSKKKKRRSVRDDDNDSIASSPAKIEDSAETSSSKGKKKSGGILGLFSKAIGDAAESRRSKEGLEKADEPADEDRKGKKKSKRRSGDASGILGAAAAVGAASVAASELSRGGDDEDGDNRSRRTKEKRRSRQSEGLEDQDIGRPARDLSSKVLPRRGV